jgi:hypothetical protein
MLLPSAAFLLLGFGGVASQERQIAGIASPGNTIHVERELTLSYDRTTIKVSSGVPVTVQRYNDGGSYLEGQQPGEFVRAGGASILQLGIVLPFFIRARKISRHAPPPPLSGAFSHLLRLYLFQSPPSLARSW